MADHTSKQLADALVKGLLANSEWQRQIAAKAIVEAIASARTLAQSGDKG